jgi:hypothetical protein
MTGKRTSERPAATLPAHRAFVVQFRTTGGWRRRFAGRVEHLSSGRFLHFGSLRALVLFFAEFLDAPQEPRP